MKRILALILVALALLAPLGMAEHLSGSWTPSESPEITDEVQAVFDKGMENLLGVDYTPVAYLGSQVVAGTNHCVLAQARVVVPDARPYYVLIYIYEDLQGNVELMNIADLDFGTFCEYGG